MHRPSRSTADMLRNLARVGWLAEQPADFQDRMARIGRWMELPRGRRLYSVGDAADGVFGLDEGRLDVALPIGGDEEVVAHRAPAGFWIGDSALLAGTPRRISVEAASDCRLFCLPGAALRRNLEERPGDWMYFYRLSIRNTMLALGVLAEVLALPPRVRFARLLLRSAGADGSVYATQEELGRMAGMSRAAFRRAFASLIDAGAVETEYGAIRIRDVAALEAAADPQTP